MAETTPLPITLSKQSIEYYSKEGPVHRSAKFPNQFITHYKGAKTVYELLTTSFERNKSKKGFGVREKKSDGTYGDYVFQTYGEVSTQINNLGSGLRDLGLKAKDMVGIYSVNRTEWIVSAAACTYHSMVFVPLYDTLGPDAVQYVVNHAELSTVICSAKVFPHVAEVSSKCPCLKRVIVMDALEDKMRAILPQSVELYSFEQVMQRGAKAPRAHIPPTPDDLYVVMYTSGTTGNPKGVMLTNGNLVSAVGGVSQESVATSDDVHISYLPLAHIYEMIVQLNGLYDGCSVGFWRGDITGLLEDIQCLKPTILVGVPRVFNRIFDKVMAGIAEGGFLKQSLFSMAYSSKKGALIAGGNTPLWDKIVFSKIQAAMGGRVRLITTGSAPLSSEVHEFLRVTTGAKVLQGYGLTETGAALTVQLNIDADSNGHCGPPVGCCEVKLVDVPEMGYTSNANPQRGEIWVRGTNVFKGYYKEEEKTKEVLTADGWFATGDIGEWLPNGALKIIDRKKNIFKLAQGEYVAAEYLETVFIRSKYVMQIFVYGDSFKNHLVAIVVPDPDTLLPWAKSNGITDLSMKSLCSNPKVKRLVFDDMTSVGVAAKLRGFQFVKNIYLEPEQWNIENGMLTPSMKLKRPQMKTRYNDIMESLYKEPTLDGQRSNL